MDNPQVFRRVRHNYRQTLERQANEILKREKSGAGKTTTWCKQKYLRPQTPS